jgi:GntR family transcriptional regulator
MNPGAPMLRYRAPTQTLMIVPLASGAVTPGPLYKEVKSRITRELAAGAWKPGESIPSESRLAQEFAVSIGTVRKAIDELVAEKILLRQQGRGTFVVTHSEDRTLFFFFHIVGKDGSKELPVTELVSFEKVRASRDEATRLALPPGSRVFRIQNRLKLGGKPVILDEIVIPAALFADLNAERFAARDGTIYGLYQARYGINVVRISERLSATKAPPTVAEQLRLASRDPLLLIKRVAYTYNDTPVENRVSWVNTGEHEYLSDLWKTDAR